MPPKRKRQQTAGSTAAVSQPSKRAKKEKLSKKEKGVKKGKVTKKDKSAKTKKGTEKKVEKNRKVSPPHTSIDSAQAKPAVQKGDSTFKLAALLTEPGWCQALAAEMEKDYFKELEATLAADYRSAKSIFPPQDLIFSALNLTPLDKVKAVILGQDPYHDDGQAMGLAFSVPEGFQVPPSLRNIYKELRNDIPGFRIPDHGCLESWAKEGVLLLNATLTVEAHQPNSHKKYGWQKFTDEVIRTISDQRSNVVFLLWGKFAQMKQKLIDTSRHLVLKNAHPSSQTCGQFFNCKCFSKTNDSLKAAGLMPINWNIK